MPLRDINDESSFYDGDGGSGVTEMAEVAEAVAVAVAVTQSSGRSIAAVIATVVAVQQLYSNGIALATAVPSSSSGSGGGRAYGSRLLAGRWDSVYCGAVVAACRALVTAVGCGTVGAATRAQARGRGGAAVRSQVTSRKFSLGSRALRIHLECTPDPEPLLSLHSIHPSSWRTSAQPSDRSEQPSRRN